MNNAGRAWATPALRAIAQLGRGSGISDGDLQRSSTHSKQNQPFTSSPSPTLPSPSLLTEHQVWSPVSYNRDELWVLRWSGEPWANNPVDNGAAD